MLQKALLTFLSTLLLCASVSATNYREDSFEYYSDITVPNYYTGMNNYLQNVYVRERKRIVLINGDVITPIKYSDGGSFYRDSSKANQLGGWDGSSNLSDKINRTNSIKVHIGDFNGDGHSDQLLQPIASSEPGNMWLTIIYGSSGKLPLKIETIGSAPLSYGGLKTNVVELNIIDVNGDGKSDIVVEYISPDFSSYKKKAVVYGHSSSIGSLEWLHPNSPSYTVGHTAATKPNHGSIVPGGISGSFRVSESGAATFSLPLYSPKGPAGMSAGLSLSYSSQGGNGPLGMGWNINAGSIINRCPGTQYQDTDTTVARYCIDGAKLILTGGSGAQRFYASEITDISKIQRNLASTDHTEHFIVWKKDGTKHEYVQIGDASWALSKVWNPTASAYVQYDYLEVGTGTYKTMPSGFSKISVKTAAGVLINETEFNYETRPDASSIYLDGYSKSLNKRIANVSVKVGSETLRKYYMSYERSQLTGRSTLRYIQECGLKGECYEPLNFNWTQKKLKNELALNNDSVASRSLWKDSEEILSGDFNKDGFSDLLARRGRNLTVGLGEGDGTFKYNDSIINFDLPIIPTNASRKLLATDINKDGYTDIVALDVVEKSKISDDEYLFEIRLRVYESNRSKIVNDFNFILNDDIVLPVLTTSNSIDREFNNLGLRDMNGDGLLDISFASGHGAQKEIMYVQNYSAPKLRIATYLQKPTDSLSFDTVELTMPGQIKIKRPTTSEYVKAGFSHTTLGIINLDTNEQITAGEAKFVDFNNDGFTDLLFKGGKLNYNIIMQAQSSTKYIEGTQGWYVAYSSLGINGTDYNPKKVVKLSLTLDDKIILGDFNGDGFTDIHSENKLILNKANGEFVETSSVLPTNVTQGALVNLDIEHFMPLEANADGVSDFATLGVNSDKFLIGYNESGEFTFYDPKTAPTGNTFHAPMNADINGDGVPDVIVVSKDGYINSYIKGTNNPADKTPADVIQTITASNGLKTQIEYGVGILDDALYQADADAQQPHNTWALNAPVFDVTGAVHLVKRVIDDAPSNESANDTVSKRYSYVGGKLQAGGRGFLGFRKLIEVDETFNVKTVTEYAQQFPYQGMPLYTYKVTQANAFDDSGITDFISNDVYKVPSNTAIQTGIQPLSNLDAQGATTLTNKDQCRDTINAGTDAGLTWLSCSRNILNVKEYETATSASKFNPVFPFIETAIEETYHLKTKYDSSVGAQLIDRGRLLKTNITNNEYAGSIDNFYGELTKQVVETSTLSSSGSTKISHFVTSEFKYQDNNVAKWWLGRMTEQKVTTERTQGAVNSSVTSGGSSSNGGSYLVSGTTYGSLENYDISALTNDLSDAYNSSTTRKTTFSYNDNGLLQSSTIEPDSTNLSLITTYGYDSWGNKTTVIKSSASGVDADLAFWRKAETQYDANGVYATHVYEFANGESNKRLMSEVISRNALGLAEQVEGQNGVTNYKEYDGFGRIISQSDAYGSYVLTSYKFCQTDIYAPSGCNMVTTKTSNASPSQKQFSDKLGQTLRVSKIGFDGDWIHVDSNYDKVGRAITVSNPHKGNADYWSISAYDIFGRVIKTQYPDGSTSAMQYDGLYTTATDANGLNKASLKNALGQLVYVKEFTSSGAAESIYKEVNYQYDLQGNQTHIIADNNTVVTDYNLIGRAVETRDPAKGKWQYRKNALGQLVAQLNAKGDYTRNTYDDLGRLTNRTTSVLTAGTIQAPELGAQLESATWVFDTAENGIGKLHQVLGSFNYLNIQTNYSESYEYNALSQLKAKTHTIDGLSYKESWEYDSIGRLTNHYDASNGMRASPINGTQTHYNANQYVSRLSNIAGDYDYFTPTVSDNWGNITEFEYGNGVKTKAIYDVKLGRLTHLNAGKNANNDEVTDLFYAYDKVGNLDYKTDSQLGYKEDITYDKTYRVTSVAAQGIFAVQEELVDGYDLSITYDGLNSNIKTKSNYENGATYTYGDATSCNAGQCANSVLTSVGELSFEYDANGNRITENRNSVLERQSKFTSYDKPWSIEKNGNSTKFAYGASHQRIKQVSVTNGKSETLLYIGGVEMQLKDGAWYYKRRIAGYAIEEQVLNTETSAIDLKLSYVHKDYQGSVVAITNENGVIQQRLSYDIYGARRDVLYNHATGFIKPGSSMYDLIGAYTYNGELEAAVRQVALDSRGYTGHEHLDGVDLIHMNGRVFDPVSAVFLSADPNIPDASNAFYMNRYSYTLNNPVSYTDPSGYFSVGSFFRAAAVMGVNALIPGAVDEHERFRKSETGMLTYSIAITVMTSGVGTGWVAAGWAMGGGFASGYMMTGTLEGAAMGAIFAGASFGVGTMAGQIGNGVAREAARVAMHGTLGGIRARMNGGSFSSGFRSAGMATIVSHAGGFAKANITSKAGQIAAAAVVGGTVSEMSGGKFANGAVSAAFAEAYNKQSHKGRECSGRPCSTTASDELGVVDELVKENGYTSFSVRAAFGLAVGVDFIITADGISVYGGIGLGLGLSASATVGGSHGPDSAGFNIKTSASGGFGGGGNATMRISPQGVTPSVGVGTAFGASVTTTIGYKAKIKDF
ncbi:FG-GAP-like repeat-containing protein [Pseudomonas sp. HK3]